MTDENERRQLAHNGGGHVAGTKQEERPFYDPDAPIPKRDLDQVFDLMVETLNEQMDMLRRRSGPGKAFRPSEMADLLKMSQSIQAAYRARPGKVADPLDQKPGESDGDYAARLEKMQGK